jgi:transposase
MEPLLHFGAGGGDAGGGAVADEAGGFGGILPALAAARMIIEGTHSGWVREVVVGCGHEVLVANPRLMDGTKRRKRKKDRIDANKLARMGRIDPQSLFPIEHRGTEVRQDLVVLRARDALVTAGRN